jgi:hypothetical protein
MRRARWILVVAVVLVAAVVAAVALSDDSDDALTRDEPASSGEEAGVGAGEAAAGLPGGPERGPKVLVAGPDGKPVRCQDGRLLRIGADTAPPSADNLEESSATDEGEIQVVTDEDEFVPRCGDDGEIAWFRASEDPLATDRP